jgi:hypothetical protein
MMVLKLSAEIEEFSEGETSGRLPASVHLWGDGLGEAGAEVHRRLGGLEQVQLAHRRVIGSLQERCVCCANTCSYLVPEVENETLNTF